LLSAEVGDSSSVGRQTGTHGAADRSSLDCNAHLWSCIFAQVSALDSPRPVNNTSELPTVSGARLFDNSLLSQDSMRHHLNALERDDISCIDDMEWFLFPDSFRASSVLEAIVVMLSVKSLHRQLTAQRHLAVMLIEKQVTDTDSTGIPIEVSVSVWRSLSGYVRFCDHVTTGYGSKLYRNFLPNSDSINRWQPNPQFAQNLGADNRSILEDRVTIVDSFLGLLLGFIVAAERIILANVVPPSPLTVSLLPQHFQSGLLEGEELVHHMMCILAVKPVKFQGRGSGNGTDHVINCIDSTDIMNWINMVIRQYQECREALSRPARKIMNMIILCNASNNAGSVTAARRVQILRQICGLGNAVLDCGSCSSPGHGGSNVTPTVGVGIPVISPVILEASVLLLMAVTPFVRELFRGQENSLSSPMHSETLSSPNGGIMHPDFNSPVDTTAQFQFENAGGYAMWLMEVGLLRSAVKSGDVAFQQSHLYYYYSDPWEVKAMPESAAAADIARFGRYKYLTVTPHCGSGALAGLMKLYAHRDFYGRFAESPPRRGINNNVEARYIVDQAQDIRKLWESLRAESWLLTVIGSAFEYAERENGGRHINTSAFLPTSMVPPGSTTLSSAVTGPYQACLSRYLYRNSLFGRLSLPHRFLAGLQVDIFGLKEVTAAAQQSAFGFSSASSALDLFAVVRLMRSPQAPSSASSPAIGRLGSTAKTSAYSSSPGGLTSSSASAMHAFSNITSLVSSVSAAAHSSGSGAHSGSSNRVPWNGASTTNVKRVEGVRGPSAGAGTMATEYGWRDQATFKCSLAEGLISLRGSSQQQKHTQKTRGY
jgi:hypothetical protein